jgi:Fe-S-cluster containining protein
VTEELPEIVRQAAVRPEVRQAVEVLYAEVAQRIAERKPVCSISGRCCRFEEYGHRLYVTTIELATFLHSIEAVRITGRSLPQIAGWNGAGCPFQVKGLCGVHTIRPFGCRMYFCDPAAQEWQNQTYEHFHSRLKSLHERFEVPYRYIEWRAALKALQLT